MRMIILFFVCSVTLPSLAQNTCHTNPQGTTICSTSDGVVHGNTNSVGSSVYRDGRGNLLEFQTDQFGNASVKLRSGEPIQWSQPILGKLKYPTVKNPGLQRPLALQPIKHPMTNTFPP